MCVARVGVAPGIEDGDHRFAAHVLCGEAGLLHPRAMRERAHVVTTEPSLAPEIGGLYSSSAHAVRSRKRLRDGRELLHARRVERRDIGWDWSGGGDARQLGGVVQHPGRSPGVAQVLERHERRA